MDNIGTAIDFQLVFAFAFSFDSKFYSWWIALRNKV